LPRLDPDDLLIVPGNFSSVPNARFQNDAGRRVGKRFPETAAVRIDSAPQSA
jgi:hypothetical protein